MFIFLCVKQSCKEAELSNKLEHPTFARTTPLNHNVARMVIGMLKKFKWNKFSVMYEESAGTWNDMYKALRHEMTSEMEITDEQSYKKTDAFIMYYDSLKHIFESFLNRLMKRKLVKRNKKGMCCSYNKTKDIEPFSVKSYRKSVSHYGTQ